jgi:hypothetical protein
MKEVEEVVPFKPFNVGDKVTSLIYGRGIVIATDSHIPILGSVITYPIKVKFQAPNLKEHDVFMHSTDGRLYYCEIVTLYHGHGKFNIEFIKDKEYKYQVKFEYHGKHHLTTNYHASEKDFYEKFGVRTGAKFIELYEETKKEA